MIRRDWPEHPRGPITPRPPSRYEPLTRQSLETYTQTLHAALSAARVLLAHAAIDADAGTLHAWQRICEEVDHADALVEAFRYLA